MVFAIKSHESFHQSTHGMAEKNIFAMSHRKFRMLSQMQMANRWGTDTHFDCGYSYTHSSKPCRVCSLSRSVFGQFMVSVCNELKWFSSFDWFFRSRFSFLPQREREKANKQSMSPNVNIAMLGGRFSNPLHLYVYTYVHRKLALKSCDLMSCCNRQFPTYLYGQFSSRWHILFRYSYTL